MAPRTYASALEHLSLLQSNHAITSLFAPPSPASPSAQPPTKEELNARAMPEMREWLARGGVSPADLASRLRCVHVAGTKGKGSVCAYLTAILTQPGAAGAGRVGTYTSPHLLTVRERIQLDGRPVGEDLFARYFFETWDAFTAAARDSITTNSKVPSDAELAGPATKPFYFRFLTIMALRVFLGEGVRSAVIECGIGGEHDSTNVLPAEAVTAAVVSQLGIDHVGMLGASLPEIAWHKAGVCRPGRRCFTRRLDDEQTMEVLRRRAAEKRADLVELDDGAVEAWGGVPRRGTLEGAFQKYNQALAALAAQEHLRVLRQEDGEGENEGEGSSLDSLPGFVLEGLARARLRGRCEVVRDGAVTWFVDGAHTGESLAEAGAWFAEQVQERRLVLVFNQQERDAAALLRRLVHESGVFFSAAVFTRNDAQARGADEPPRDLAVQRACADAMAALAPATEARVVESVPEAVARVREIAAGAEVGVLATGSLHLVGALLRTLEGEGEGADA
ncbi:FolC bifunctional protein [Biscogniauxia mediterranea]|nr:FolC bifunctional protein [Biscogniauxia mediterranea]